MKATVAFAALQARRVNAKRFWVVALTKSGDLSKSPVSDINKSRTRDQAESNLKRMESLNPSSKFVIIES